MEFESYKQFWNHQAATPESALAAVDGSASEEVVQITGRFTARQVATALELKPVNASSIWATRRFTNSNAPASKPWPTTV